MYYITFFGVFIGLSACNSRSETTANSVDVELRNPPALDSAYVKLCAKSFGNGLLLFNIHCHQCHAMPHEDVRDSYTFDTYFERVPKPAETYFIRYISGSEALRKSGDAYALKIHQEYNSTFDHTFKDKLGEQDLNDLIFYIKLGVKLKHIH